MSGCVRCLQETALTGHHVCRRVLQAMLHACLGEVELCTRLGACARANACCIVSFSVLSSRPVLRHSCCLHGTVCGVSELRYCVTGPDPNCHYSKDIALHARSMR